MCRSIFIGPEHIKNKYEVNGGESSVYANGSGARRMQVFIDESGTFTGYHAGSISVVGALAIPDGNMPRLRKKYARIRKGLLTDGNEVKGLNLNAAQVNRVVRLIKDRDAIFEVTAVDLGLHL